MNPTPTPSSLESLLTEREAAAFLKLSPNTLSVWRSQGYGPPYLKLGRRTVRYRMTDLAAWAGGRSGTPA